MDRITKDDLRKEIEKVNQYRGMRALSWESHNQGDGRHYHIEDEGGSRQVFTGPIREVYSFARGMVRGLAECRAKEAEHAEGWGNVETRDAWRYVSNTQQFYTHARMLASESGHQPVIVNPEIDAADRLESWFDLLESEVRGDEYLSDDPRFNQEKRDFVIGVGSGHRVDWREIARHMIDGFIKA